MIVMFIIFSFSSNLSIFYLGIDITEAFVLSIACLLRVNDPK